MRIFLRRGWSLGSFHGIFAGWAKRYWLLVALCAFALVCARAAAGYPGSIGVFLFFSTNYLLLVLCAIPKPRCYAYTFFAALLFLGFWSKLSLHLVLDYPFIEPIGRFDWKAKSWDQALIVATCGAIGVMIPRLLQLVICKRRHDAKEMGATASWVPAWYVVHRKFIWLSMALIILGLNVWNFEAAFYQIGVNPKLILPLHLNVVTGWLINIGFGLAGAIVFGWEVARESRNLTAGLLFVIAEACVSSSSALSRSIYFLRTAPYGLVLAEKWKTICPMLTNRELMLTGLAAILGMVLSLSIVTWFRLQIFPATFTLTTYSESSMTSVTIAPFKDTDTKGAPVNASEIRAVYDKTINLTLVQISRLFLDRWIGMEGVLSVSAYPDVGRELLKEGLLESPTQGSSSLYQRIAGSAYRESKDFTFLTSPGVVAALYYSGSLLMVLVGMAGVAAIMIGTEAAAARWIQNDFLLSFCGLAMANVICQLNFPYLGLVFLMELWVALFFTWRVQEFSKRKQRDD
jgi:hypothetical protein